MRLKNTKESEMFERKRTRSSLDVKVSNGENLTRPPKSKKPETPQYDFSDLEGMSEDEIMQALYDDPELAAAAAAAAEKMHTEEKSSSSPPPRSRTVSEYPDHLRAMMDEGVPVKQWIILLVLLGAGLYQLRRALVGSSSSNTKKKLEKPTKVEKSSRKAGKQKGKKKSSSFVKSRSAPVATTSAPKLQPALVEEAPVEAAPKKATKNKKKSRNKQKNKPPQPAVEAKKEETDALSHESPDSVSTDGSSSTTGAAQHEEQVAPTHAPNKVESVVVDNQALLSDEGDEGDGWQTVGAPVVESKPERKVVVERKPVPAPAPAVEEAPVAEPTPAPEKEEVEEEEKPEEVETKVLVEPTNGNTVAPAAPAPASDSQAFKPAKKKKAKKKATSEEAPDDAAADDEALAKQLQLQEEKIAEHEATKAQEDDVWEEVTIKKKKR